jgi:hypothetical protein
MSSSILKLQQDMCAAIVDKGAVDFNGVELDVATKAAELEATATPESLLMLYLCIMTVAKRIGYNGFSDDVSKRFLELHKTPEPNRMVALDKSGVTT